MRNIHLTMFLEMHPLLCGAGPAHAIMFDNRAVDSKSVRLAIRMVMGVSLFDFLACLANKELRHMSAMAMIAGDKGIKRFNAVDKTKLGEKIQGAVNRWGFRRADFGA